MPESDHSIQHLMRWFHYTLSKGTDQLRTHNFLDDVVVLSDEADYLLPSLNDLRRRQYNAAEQSNRQHSNLLSWLVLLLL